MNEPVFVSDTLARLKRPGLTRESIALLVVRLLELRNPDKTVVMPGNDEINLISSDGSRTQIFIHYVLAECHRDPDNRPEIVERYLRGLSPESSDLGQPVSHSDVVVLIRDSAYCDFIAGDDRSVRPRHLIADLWVVYAADRPQSTTVLLVKDMAGLGVSSADVESLGKQNLGRLVNDLETTSYGDWFSLVSKSSEYLAGTILLDYVWEQLGALVEGDLVVAVPARDTVIFTGSSNVAGLRLLRETADSVFKNGDHVISTTLLRRVGDTWKLLSCGPKPQSISQPSLD